jgi:DNA invertase Pin-like site-specific DNA recombinase
VATPKPMDGYVRVSRLAGREGASFISPEVQHRRIEAWADAGGVEIVQWWEELDRSGAKRDRPMFQEALARCERGETGGIVVAKLDRFARSAVDALESIKRLNDAGARLVSVEDGFDGSTAMGRFAIGILTLIAELELERIRENWDTAVREAVKRGVHISPKVPTGYRKEEKSGRLTPDPVAGPVIAEAFRLRATGMSYTKLAEFLDGKGVPPSSGNPNWSVTGVDRLLHNPVYLGQARSGSVVNDDAHEPLITRAEFDGAQAVRTRLDARQGSPAALVLLGGLVRCAGCGHTLKITGSKGRNGVYYPTYYCSKRFATGICRAPATIAAHYIDRYVEEQVLTALRAEDGLLAQAAQASAQLEHTQRRVDQAEHELDQFITDPELLTLLGKQKFMQGAEARQRALDQARAELSALRSQGTLAEELTTGDLLGAWPTLTIPERRQLLHGLLDRVVLRAGPSMRNKNTTPVAARTQIVLRGEVLLAG